MKTRNFIILIVLIGLGGFLVYKNLLVSRELIPEETTLPEQEQPPAVEFDLVKKSEIGSGIFSGIIFSNNRFYISFERDQRVYVREYDANLAAIGKLHQLTANSIRVSDHKMVLVDNYFYLAHSVPEAGTLILKKFDSDFNEVGTTTVVSSAENEATNDMLLSYAGGFLYIGTFYAPPGQNSGQRIRKYSTDLELVDEFVISDVNNINGSSMLFVDSAFVIVSSDKFWDDSSLIVMRYDANWNFIDSKTISAVSGANERFPMGLLFENGRYLVSYTHATDNISSPPPGELPPDYGDIILKAFDQDWNSLGQTTVTDDLPANSANRAHLAWANGRAYVSYDTSEFKIIVKEYIVR